MVAEFMEKAKINQCKRFSSYSGIGVNVLGLLAPISFVDPCLKDEEIYETAFCWTINHEIADIMEWFQSATKRGSCVADVLNAYKGASLVICDKMDGIIEQKFPSVRSLSTHLRPCHFELVLDWKHFRIQYTEEQLQNVIDRNLKVIEDLEAQFKHGKAQSRDFADFMKSLKADLKSGLLFDEECVNGSDCPCCCTNADSLTALMEHWEPTCD